MSAMEKAGRWQLPTLILQETGLQIGRKKGASKLHDLNLTTQWSEEMSACILHPGCNAALGGGLMRFTDDASCHSAHVGPECFNSRFLRVSVPGKLMLFVAR